jgi:hypothetical protein
VAALVAAARQPNPKLSDARAATRVAKANTDEQRREQAQDKWLRSHAPCGPQPTAAFAGRHRRVTPVACDDEGDDGSDDCVDGEQGASLAPLPPVPIHIEEALCAGHLLAAAELNAMRTVVARHAAATGAATEAARQRASSTRAASASRGGGDGGSPPR